MEPGTSGEKEFAAQKIREERDTLKPLQYEEYREEQVASKVENLWGVRQKLGRQTKKFFNS